MLLLLRHALLRHALALMLVGGVARASKSALLVIDVQNCFTSGGTLEVPDADAVIPVINRLRDGFPVVLLSQDWHCLDHVSFASQHPSHDVYDVIMLTYDAQGELCEENSTETGCDRQVQQVLWPDHCVINTTDAAFRTDLITHPQDIVIRKGHDCHVDSYSVFYNNGGVGSTPADELLRAEGVTDVYVVGLARDYCVYWSAKDALSLGYETHVIVDATRPVANETGDAALEDMEKLGVHLLLSSDLPEPSRATVTSSWTVTLLVSSLMVVLAQTAQGA